MDELSPEQLDRLTVWQNMQSAQRSLHHARLAINGREIVPEADVARHWLLITGIYSLLEQSLKFLCRLQDPAYIYKEKGHNLYGVYQQLEEEHKQDLRRFFDEYASFVGITGLDLDKYLQEKGGDNKRYGYWRYFLIEQDLKKLDQGQSYPFYTDLMLEIINGVLDIIRAHIHQGPIMNNVSYRLQREIRLAPGGSESDTAEVKAWREENPCLINACSRWLRVGPLEHHRSPFLRDWVERTMSNSVEVDTKFDQARGRNAKLGIAHDMAIFKHHAKRSCFTWDGEKGRFVSRNHLPEPVDDIQLQGKWSLIWKTDQAVWTGRIRRALTKIPTRVSQCVSIGIDGMLEDEGGNQVDAHGLLSDDDNQAGDLLVEMNGKQVVEMAARLWTISGYDRLEFVKTDHDRDLPDRFYIDFQCITCQGTGFCAECLGESEDDDCKCVSGRCFDCKGYGEDGQHLLAQVANPKPAWMCLWPS